MKYPKFLSNGSTIGITAMSAGVGRKLEEFELSIENIKKNGFEVIETKSVRVNGYVSNTGEVRARELDELVTNKNIDMVMCASGGDFCLDMLPYINIENIKNNPKWFMGASDPTSVLYYITTKLDIATMYGHNAGGFDQVQLHESCSKYFDFLKGNISRQNSYELYESDKKYRTTEKYLLDTPVVYENINGDMDVTGRLIGGCIDVLKDIIGTKYDGTLEFIEKYKDDGIIWYFDNFALSSDSLYRTLIQFRDAGWFNYTKGIIVGRVMYPSCNFDDFTYQDALSKAINDIPIVFNADIGHVVPKMTLINGAICHAICSNGKGSLEFELR